MDAYLVLLQVGFTLPLLLPVARCALTAPFHPYLLGVCTPNIGGSALCCTFRQFTLPRRYLALCPLKPRLSSPFAGGDRLADSQGRKDNRLCIIGKKFNLILPKCHLHQQNSYDSLLLQNYRLYVFWQDNSILHHWDKRSNGSLCPSQPRTLIKTHTS